MLKLYAFLMASSAPALNMMLWRRAAKGKEDKKRITERRGVASSPRPEGKLIWLHGASVGESQSMLVLIDALLEKHKQLNILVTTGTVTSAELMSKRLPRQVIHQYYPFDNPIWVNAFLNHWKPDMALWIESELWPNMLHSLKQKEIPTSLINAHLSERSYERWKKSRKSITYVTCFV